MDGRGRVCFLTLQEEATPPGTYGQHKWGLMGENEKLGGKGRQEGSGKPWWKGNYNQIPCYEIIKELIILLLLLNQEQQVKSPGNDTELEKEGDVLQRKQRAQNSEHKCPVLGGNLA